jgi:hypothetical protein
VSDALRNIIQRVIEGHTTVDPKAYGRLNDREQHLLRSLARFIGLGLAAGLPDKSALMDEQMRVALAEIAAVLETPTRP